jgi:hypothetical protein
MTKYDAIKTAAWTTFYSSATAGLAYLFLCAKSFAFGLVG